MKTLLFLTVSLPAFAGLISVSGADCSHYGTSGPGTMTCPGVMDSAGQLLGFAQASIFNESFGNLNVQARAWGFYGASAYAHASYDEMMDYGPAPGVVVGVYGLGSLDLGYERSITQGLNPVRCQSCRTFTLVTNYDGTPIEVAASVTAAVVDRNFDQEGIFLESLTYTADVPEPNTFWLVAVPFILARKYSRSAK